ncbi:MAG TPA: hypothetical protein VHR66_25880 [Gemmataceae bacterium]|nr:hypothetical protein [Gemmataceae bacterium]
MLARCRQAQKPIKVRIDHLLDLPDNDRFMALDLVREIGECQVFVNEVKQLGLLDGTLALMNNSPDIERARRGKMAALEAAVLTCPDALDLQCSRIKERMKAIGIKGIQQRDLERDARNILQHLSGPFHN